MVAIDIEVPPDLANFLGGGAGKAILDELEKRAQEIADIEQRHVEDRTPVLTGALKESVKGVKGAAGQGRAPGGGRSLATVYFQDEDQLAEWGRIYAPYQEGPPLGLSTYTNPPRQPLYLADPEDIPDITAWAEGVAQDVTNTLVP